MGVRRNQPVVPAGAQMDAFDMQEVEFDILRRLAIEEETGNGRCFGHLFRFARRREKLRHAGLGRKPTHSLVVSQFGVWLSTFFTTEATVL